MKKEIEIRDRKEIVTYFNDDGSVKRRRVRTIVDKNKKSLTQQQYRDRQDVNIIMKKYYQTGGRYDTLPDAARGTFADLSDFNYEESMNKIARADEAFMHLDSELRLRFANDPQRFLRFMADPANADEIYKLGLAVKKPIPEPSVQDQTLATLKEIRDQGKKPKKEPAE